MNIPLLRKIVAKVMAAPDTLDMYVWGILVDRDEDHPCGAVACLAGNAVLIEDRKTFRHLAKSPAFREDIQDVARELLGLSDMEAGRLFHLDEWPDEFREDYETPRAEANDRAAVLRDRVEHFISTEGAE